MGSHRHAGGVLIMASTPERQMTETKGLPLFRLGALILVSIVAVLLPRDARAQVTADVVSPSSGTGATQTFTLTYSNVGGRTTSRRLLCCSTRRRPMS